MQPTYDCEPTLDDFGVLKFCQNGFLSFPGVVPDEINQRALKFMEDWEGAEPSHILHEDWFVENVICHPEVAGAVRCLLGRDFGLPILMSSHKVHCPQPAQEWHRDGGSKWGPPVNYLQVFYYPQDTPAEMGPTELLPGSHHLFSLSTFMGHYGSIIGAQLAESPAGSILITAYNIWHRRGKSTAAAVRNNLKYNYWRRTAPEKTWTSHPDFDPEKIEWRDEDWEVPTFRQQFRDSYDAAEQFMWLSGKHDKFGTIGGQGWPVPGNNLERQYGIPDGIKH